MSNMDRYTKHIAEQVRKEGGYAINESAEGTHTYGADPENTSESKAERAYGHVDSVLAHAEKKGYKINHNDGVSKKAHAKPDITFHTDGNDDAPSAYTVHAGGAAHGDSKVHPGAKHYAHMYSGSPA